MSDFLKVVQAVKAGNGALTLWQKLDPADRLQKLTLSPDLLESSQVELLRSLSRETGAPETANLDLTQAITALRRVLELAQQYQSSPDFSYLPVGLIGILTDAKNPFTSSLTRIMCALTLGNAVIWQPSAEIEKTSSMLVELLNSKLQLPEGLLNLLPASSIEVTNGIIDHPGIHQLMFAGSTPAGKEIYSRAAQAGKRIQLSMGARNPAIIFADTDLPSEIEAMAQSFFDFHGLGRWRASRIFVQETIYKQFLDELKNYLQKTPNYIGGLASNDKAKFEAAFNQAIQEKGKSLLDPGTNSTDPKVIFDLTNCSTLQQDEIDGPLITVSSFKYQFDALKYANTSPLGKAAYVWSSDSDKAKKVARKLEVGRVFVNELPKSFVSDRYIGAKESGLGAEGISDLIEFCSHKVNVT